MGFALEEKRRLLETLYEFIETTYKSFPLACVPGCKLCCTERIWATSLEAYYLLDVFSEEEYDFLETWAKEGYSRPVVTTNQLALCYLQGGEPPLEPAYEGLKPCPFLTSEDLCKFYERRPLMCRVMASVKICKDFAELPPFLFQVSTLAFQIVESIDIGGVYGSLFDLLRFLKRYQEGLVKEIPEELLSNVELEEFSILPEERELKRWLGELYRTPVRGTSYTFRELWQKLRKDFEKYQRLNFLKDLF